MNGETTRIRYVARLVRHGAMLMVAMPVVGLVLMVIADNVPDRLVMDALFDATVAGSIDAEDYAFGTVGSRIDSFTECIAITNGVGDRAEVNTVSSAIRGPTLGKCSAAVPAIEGWAQGGGLERQYDYFRYWHGYSVVFRPVLAVVGVAGLRVLAQLALYSSAIFLATRFSRSFGVAAGGALVAPLVLSTDFVDLHQALPHALSMVVMLVTAAFWLRSGVRSWSLARMAAGAAISGALFVFVDFLINPPAAWALTTAMIGVTWAFDRGDRRDLASTVVRLAVAGAAWGAGYAWMWFSKWVIATTVFGVKTVRGGVSAQLGIRLDGDQPGVQQQWFAPWRANWREWQFQPLAQKVLLATVLLVVSASVFRLMRDRFDATDLARRAVVASPVLIPVAWFEVLRNHSQVHAWFTYRSIPIALGIMAAAFLIKRPDAVAAPGASAAVQVEDTEHETGDDQLQTDRRRGDGRDHDPHRV